MDSEQGKPAEADDERDALEQSGHVHQPFGLSEARAGEDERTHEDDTCNGRVGRPSALPSRGEPAAEYEAGDWQSQEERSREQVVEDTVRAVVEALVRAPRRITIHRIGDEDARAEQPDRACPNQERFPG